MLPRSAERAQHQAEGPTAFKGRAAARRLLMFKEARELLTALPEQGESLHCIQSGNLDLTVLLMQILAMHPGLVATCG